MGTITVDARVRMPLTAQGHAVLGTDFTVQGWSHPPSHIHVLLFAQGGQLVHLTTEPVCTRTCTIGSHVSEFIVEFLFIG